MDKSKQKETTKRSAPLPGELVQIENSTDPLIKDGSYGVIEGILNMERGEYFVCFNAYSTFKDGSHVSCSGGPCFIISVTELMDTNSTKEWTFWRWADLPRAGGGITYSSKVKVWKFNMCKRGERQAILCTQ